MAKNTKERRDGRDEGAGAGRMIAGAMAAGAMVLVPAAIAVARVATTRMDAERQERRRGMLAVPILGAVFAGIVALAAWVGRDRLPALADDVRNSMAEAIEKYGPAGVDPGSFGRDRQQLGDVEVPTYGASLPA